MKTKETYFYIMILYSRGNREFLIKEGIIKRNSSTTGRHSAHIVKATSEKLALKIAEKHGIANPFNSKFIEERMSKRLDMRFSHNKELIKRRKQRIGGYIWYEDKDENLQKET